MRIYGVTIFLSAFLLFQVQLFLGKYILPWFGGVPAVWTTCMLFFQLLLLAGYAYAHWIAAHLSARAQRALHLALLAAPLTVLALLYGSWGSPVLPDAGWKPHADQAPVGHIVRLLAAAVGLPFFVLSATGPLTQAWFSNRHPGRSPYRLYALSNLGSLLGLLSYPFAIEVWLPLRDQALLWAAGFLIFAVGMAACAMRAGQAPGAAAPGAGPAAAAAPRAIRFALWFGLAACASVLLLATTNQMSQEIAVVPFLWMLPLCLYLLSFILCFDSERWYARGRYAPLLVLGLVLSAVVLEQGAHTHLVAQIAVPALTLFVACMVCHGELVRLKPAPRHLTAFYLTVTAGGAAGGLFVGIAAPALFPALWEYPIALWAVAALLLAMLVRDRASVLYHGASWPVYAVAVAAALTVLVAVRDSLLPALPEPPGAWLFGAPLGITAAGLWLHRLQRRDKPRTARPGPAVAAGCAALGLFAVALGHLAYRPLADSVYHSRNFYGMLQVVEERPADAAAHRYKLRHGRIIHGYQYRAAARRHQPTSYYGHDSGVGLAIVSHPRRAQGLRIGVIGLGIGTLAAYGQRGDTLRFYEINPDVLRLAGVQATTFTYLRSSPARIEHALGDARIVLERELAHGRPGRFHILAVDAFSSDSIPIHLLTAEAVEVYLRHLDTQGVLAVHITNHFLDLKPVVRALAQRFELAYAFVEAQEGNLTWGNTWALLSRQPSLLEAPAIARAAARDEERDKHILWTDDYSNLLGALKL